ncbi:MAG TPA: hypothetical protein VFF65_03120 [Phycisphaerales bacterium]|nr:hypothetical protein [Phycisphaerales bacterium]
MKNRTKLIATALLTTAALGACAHDDNYAGSSADNRGMMDGRWPDWNNNGPSDARSTTLGPGGNGGEYYDWNNSTNNGNPNGSGSMNNNTTTYPNNTNGTTYPRSY